MAKCKNCGHFLLKHINKKTKKVVWLHFNRYYFGLVGINHKYCSKCEVLEPHKYCDKPQVYKAPKKVI